MSREFERHLKDNGTVHMKTVHDSPQQNGAAERKNRVLLELARAMHFAAGLPWRLWSEAVNHAAWVINHTPTAALGGKTPISIAKGVTPDVSNLPVWGMHVWVHIKPKDKLTERVLEG